MFIQIFTTGGTIDKVYFDAKSTYEVGESNVRDMLEEAHATVNVEVERLFRKDSLEMTDTDREALARRVQRAQAQRVLVTHGTDTMVLSARALQEATSEKTVVLTGSLQPARFRSSDAIFNIGFAMAAVQLLAPGVYVAMNGRVFDPDEVRKNRDKNCFEEKRAK